MEKVLLSSVFKPYALDDEYGSRKNNPMELYHNQVTREQGVFSLRMFHPSLGLRLIQANIDTHCDVLDFPTLRRFEEQLKLGYDVVGISSITVNLFKVRKMCELVRKHLPKAQIVIGGTIANMKDLKGRIDADVIIQGDGLAWFRERFGARQLRHPVAEASYGTRILGGDVPSDDSSVVLVPALGCPMGCNFCMTSATFGGKGKSIVFYKEASALYSLMDKIEKISGAKSFFIMDENFLLDRQRTLGLLDLFRKGKKDYSLAVFSSANALRQYDPEQLVQLGISFAWIGLEGPGSAYTKTGGIDTKKLVEDLQMNGIVTLGSSILGLEDHTVENIPGVIDWAVSHRTDFHQFMLYTPLPGTPFYERCEKEGRLLSEEECPLPDTHGQQRFNYRHWNITDQKETELLTGAFVKDFEENGPSITRMIRTRLLGWQRHSRHPEMRVRRRIQRESKNLGTTLSGVVWAARSWYQHDPRKHSRLVALQKKIAQDFPASRIIAPTVGSYLGHMMKAEDRRLKQGFSYEPGTLLVTKREARYITA